MDYDALLRGLAKVDVKGVGGPVAFDGIAKRYFPTEEGTDQDVIRASYEDWGVALPDMVVRGDDPSRVNYKTPFNEKYIEGAYYFVEQELKLADAQNRVFDEPLDSPWSVEQRQLYLAAKIRDRIHRNFVFAKQKVLADVVFTGKFTTKNGGEQSFPVVAKNLELAGANLSTEPIKVLSKAVTALVKKGRIVDTLILNPEDAITLASATGWQSVLDKTHIASEMETKALGEDGFAYVGTIPSVGSGSLKVLAYYGTTDGTSFFVPQGKALLVGAPIGVMGYCGVLTSQNGVQAQVSAKEMFTIDAEERGALVKTRLQGQTAPCPIVYNVDGYGVLINIS